jgi:hypothetical protein
MAKTKSKLAESAKRMLQAVQREIDAIAPLGLSDEGVYVYAHYAGIAEALERVLKRFGRKPAPSLERVLKRRFGRKPAPARVRVRRR